MPRRDLMEAGEASAVVGAILWLAQTILETLQPGKLADWLRQVGLAGAIEELKSEVERMETVVNGVNGRAVGNKPLARSLARVKELMYDADDVVDELDYCRIQQKVEGVMLAPAIEPERMVGDAAEQVDALANTVVMLAPAIEPEGMVGDGAEPVDTPTNTAGLSSNNCRKNRSKERDYFHITPAVNGEPARAKCIDCGTQVVFNHGTSVLRKHRNSASCKKKRAAIQEAPNCPSARDSVQNSAMILTNGSEGRKRMRTEDNVVTSTLPWDKARFSERIHEIALELESIRVYVIEYLKDSVASFNQYQSNTNSDAQVRTSGSLQGKVYGRHMEKNHIMSLIKAPTSDIITVVPIVGIVGIGKTALAKVVYNHPIVEREFERIWVWVSNIFDEVRVTREILDAITLGRHEGPLYNRESYGGVCNYTKHQEVLKKHMACQTRKFLLVLDDVYDCMDDSQWKDLLDALGSSCTKGNLIIVTARNLSIAQRVGTVEPVKLRALNDDNFLQLFKACAFGDNNCREHLEIGRQISAQLKGNPLAAKSAADMLREQPTRQHWKSIMNNGVWESLQPRGGIVTALKMSYYQLPYNLQQCLLFCSIFPNGYLFNIENLVYMWISSRFVKSAEIGRGYLNDLVNSGFFEQVYKTDSILGCQTCYVVCGIVHDFARLISKTEFATIDGSECKEVLPTVRHFSILTDSVYHRDEQGFIVRNVEFEEKLQSLVSSVKRLRMLILIGNYDPLFLRSFHAFMCNSVNCTHLRYLKLENKGSSEDLPISLSKFYHLETLDVEFQAIHDMSDLISMRHLVLKKGAHGVSSPAWSACLQTIHLEDCEGWEALPSLESLSSLTKLKLRNMSKVMALLIPSLEELVLIDMPKLCTCFTCSVRDLNSSLRILEIRRCLVLMSFSLFERCGQFEIEQKSWLPNVNELTVHECPHLMVSNPLPPSSTFCKLSITKLSTFPDMEGSSTMEIAIKGHLIFSALSLDDKILSFHNLRTITRLKIEGVADLSYFSIEGLKQLVCLKRLEICSCINFSPLLHVLSTRAHEDMAAEDFDALPSLECFIIKDCAGTEEWLSVMLQHVRALEELHLVRCPWITWLLIEGEENSFSNLTLAPRASSQGNLDSTSTRSCPDKLLRVPSNLVSSLKKMSIEYCKLKLHGNKEGFSEFTSLEELSIGYCPEMISSLVHEDETDGQANGRWLLPYSLGVLDISFASLGTLQPCFPRDLTRLRVLEVGDISELKSLQLHSCTALEKLTIESCESLDALEGFQCLHSLVCFKVYECPGLKSLQLHSCTALEKLTIGFCISLETLEGVQSLRSLRYLDVYCCPGLPQCLESLSTQGYEVCPRLEKLCIDDLSFLTTPFCKHLTSLQSLQLENICEDDAAGLTCEQEAAIQLLTSLQELEFDGYYELSDLPVGLHNLLSLKRLEIFSCKSISRLPERGLPPSLEELEVFKCSELLTEQCRKLATSKLIVKIDEEYVD